MEFAIAELLEQLSQCEAEIRDESALTTTLKRLGIPEVAFQAIEKHYSEVEPSPPTCLLATSYEVAAGLNSSWTLV